MVTGQGLFNAAQSLRDSVNNFPEVLAKTLGTDQVWILIQMVDWESHPDRYLSGAFFQKEDALAALPDNRLERTIRGDQVFYNLDSRDLTDTQEKRSKRGKEEMDYYDNHGNHGNGLVILKEVSLSSIRQENPRFYKDLMVHLLDLQED